MTVVTVPWNNQHGLFWNETCAMVIEHFGLPGDKFTYCPSEERMEFKFNNEHDALMCKILLSDRL